MGVFAGPDVSESGLVLALDAGNVKGFDSNENLLSNSIRTADHSGATSGTGWTLTSNNSTAPDGSVTATLLTQTSSLSNSGILWINGGNASGQVMSIFCKPVSGSAIIQGQTGNGDGWSANLSTNTFTDSSSNGRHANGRVEEYSNGWKRVSIPMFNVPPLAGGGDFVGSNFYLTISGTGSVLLWGWQRENGSSASTYYPTSGTAKNRGTTLIDMTGRGNNGTLTNGPTYSSANGGSIVFDGTNDVVNGTITGSIFTGNFTQSAWIYKLNNTQIWQGVFTNSSPATNNTYLMTFGNGSVEAPFNSVGVNQVGISPAGVFLDIGTHTNRWLYIVITKTGSTLNIYCYKDGSLLQTSGTINWNGGNFATTNNYQIAQHWTGGSVVPFQGNIAQVSIYNRALTAAEIQQNFNATRGRFGV